mgnify:FL=1
MSDKDIIEEAQEAYKAAVDADADIHRDWVEDMRFARLGEHWPAEVKRQRELEGRPCLTFNRFPAFMRQVTNDARQNRPAIAVHPVGDGADQETAEILQGLIRNIEYSSQADVAYDTALEHAVGGGFGYFRICTDYAAEDMFEQDICIERIANPLMVHGDPECMDADSANWNSAFISEFYTEHAYKKKFGKDAPAIDWEADANDKNRLWFGQEGVRVAEWWRREDVASKLLKLSDGTVIFEGKYLELQPVLEPLGIVPVADRQTVTKRVTQYILNGETVLEKNDWKGRFIPIIPVYGDEVIVEGERKLISLTRFAKDAARMYNYWRTASTELVALAPKAPFIGPKGAFRSDAKKWASANTKTHPYIEYDGQTPPQRQGFDGPPAAALQEALNASDDMKSIMGLFDASLGAKSNETSGRAILARQREGDVSTFNYIDNLSRAIRHAGRVMVDLIPHVYNTERIIRTIKEDGTNRKVPINQPTPAEQQKAAGDQAQQLQGVLRVYDLTTGKYDVTCEAGPSFTTKREEASVQMIEFIRAYPNAAPMIGDLLAKNLDWPGADDIADRLKAMLPPQVTGQNPQVMQLQQQMQQMDAQARQAVDSLRRELEGVKADRDIDQRKLIIDAFEAETKRMQVIGDQQAMAMQTAQQAQNDLLSQQAPQTQPPTGGFSLPAQQGIGGIGAPQ